MDNDARELARLLAEIADPRRLALLAALGDGPLAAGPLLEAAGITESEGAPELARLVGSDIVERGADGEFRLADPEMGRACASLRSLLVIRLATATRLDVFALPERRRRRWEG